MGDEEVQAGRRVALMDPGQGTRGEPREIPIPSVHCIPAMRHQNPEGGDAAIGRLAPPEDTWHGEAL